MVGLPSNKKKTEKCRAKGVNIIHRYTEDTLVSVTGCHHHRTDPRNLWKGKKKGHSYDIKAT